MGYAAAALPRRRTSGIDVEPNRRVKCMAIGITKLEPVRRVNLTSQVMESVKSYISDNGLVSGTRLPTEKELMANLGVSRNILREALKSLEAVGLIEIRPGDGMYVSDFDYSSVLTHMSFALSRSKQELANLVHARLVIEVGALDRAVERITDDDVRRLEANLAAIEAAQSIEEQAELDLEFHKEVLAIADNPILSEFGRFLGRFFLSAKSIHDAESARRTVSGHAKLIAALKSRDAETAKTAMREHILSWKPEID
jgi:GntR family transcriptional repressor for pyruvate dehydrogenase complex